MTFEDEKGQKKKKKEHCVILARWHEGLNMGIGQVSCAHLPQGQKALLANPLG